MQNDREVVLAAVTQRGDALKYASEELQNGKQMVFAAIMQLLIHKYKYSEMSGEEMIGGLSIKNLICKQVLLPMDVIHIA